jgi:hypothetical protein
MAGAARLPKAGAADTVESALRLNRWVPQTHLVAGLRRTPPDGVSGRGLGHPPPCRVISRFRGYERGSVRDSGGSMRFGNVEVRPVGGGVGCLTMLLVSVIASVVLTIVLNVLF